MADINSNAPAWFNEEHYLKSKLAQLHANGETHWSDIESVRKAIQDAGYSLHQHFATYGLVEQTSPNPLFNAHEYLQAKVRQVNEIAQDGRTDWDVQSVAEAIQNAGMTLWDHFSNHGWREKVNPSNNFDIVGYESPRGDSMSPQDAVSKTLAQDDSCSLVISALFEGKST